MTTYATELVQYTMWYGRLTESAAIEFLDKNGGPEWQTSNGEKTGGVFILNEGEGE